MPVTTPRIKVDAVAALSVQQRDMLDRVNPAIVEGMVHGYTNAIWFAVGILVVAAAINDAMNELDLALPKMGKETRWQQEPV